MHSITNISKRNKIDTQSRADAYIKRKRLISMSDDNLKSGCTYKYSWNWKNPKNSLFWANIYIKKKPKNQKKPKKPKKNPLWWFFFLNRVFPNPASRSSAGLLIFPAISSPKLMSSGLGLTITGLNTDSGSLGLFGCCCADAWTHKMNNK